MICKKRSDNMDNFKLKVKLMEKAITYKECAKAIGVSVTAFSNKVNGTSKFNVEEASILAQKLCLSNDESVDIFLK